MAFRPLEGVLDIYGWGICDRVNCLLHGQEASREKGVKVSQSPQGHALKTLRTFHWASALKGSLGTKTLKHWTLMGRDVQDQKLKHHALIFLRSMFKSFALSSVGLLLFLLFFFESFFFLNIFCWYVCLFCFTGYQTRCQGLMNTKQTLNHWATSPAPQNLFWVDVLYWICGL
jgi:hypothetical protein